MSATITAPEAIERIRELLYPGGDRDHPWDGAADYLEGIAAIVNACPPEPPAAELTIGTWKEHGAGYFVAEGVHFTLNGVSMHVCALAVVDEVAEVEGPDWPAPRAYPIQEAAKVAQLDAFASLVNLAGEPGPFQTTTIDGRECVVWMGPYAR